MRYARTDARRASHSQRVAATAAATSSVASAPLPLRERQEVLGATIRRRSCRRQRRIAIVFAVLSRWISNRCRQCVCVCKDLDGSVYASIFVPVSAKICALGELAGWLAKLAKIIGLFNILMGSTTHTTSGHRIGKLDAVSFSIQLLRMHVYVPICARACFPMNSHRRASRAYIICISSGANRGCSYSSSVCVCLFKYRCYASSKAAHYICISPRVFFLNELQPQCICGCVVCECVCECVFEHARACIFVAILPRVQIESVVQGSRARKHTERVSTPT